MKKIGSYTVALILITASITSCASVGSGPTGMLFTSTTMGVSASKAGGPKKGEACTMSILGLLAIGDGSVEAAAKAGKVSAINSINLENLSILGLFAKSCTVVRGE